MSKKNLLIENSDEGIVTLTIDRAESLNALNTELLRELTDFFSDETLAIKQKVVVLTGAGPKSFVAGADIAEMQSMNSTQALEFALCGQRLTQLMEDYPCPIVAAVGGHCLGGGLELALSCDLLLASRSGQWGLPEVKLGVIPGFGGWSRLRDSLGAARAKAMVLSGESVSSEQMQQWGVVWSIHEDAEATKSAARQLAKKLLSNGPLAMESLKKISKTSQEGLRQEAQQFAALFDSKDQKEGMQSFLARRPAVFQRH